MRVDVRKVVFVGAEESREAFFAEAQQRGLVEFINPQPTRSKETPQEVQNLMEAIRVLRGLEPVEQLETTDFSQAQDVAKAVIELHHQIEGLHEERRTLRQEIVRVRPFGAFSSEKLQELEAESGRRFQFFCAKKTADVEATANPEVIHVGEEHGLDYFVTINADRRQYEGMIEMRIEQPVNVLEQRYRACEEKMDAVEETLKTYANRNEFLHQALVAQMNRYNLESAEAFREGHMEDRVFVIQGWVSGNQVDDLTTLVASHNVHWEEVAIEETDRVPTALENEGMAKIGEDLVHIYDTPGIMDKDPSPWVLWAFALFFAMILGDGGYGALFLVGALFLRFKFAKATGMARRMITLSLILSVFCIGWGLFTHSFFGINFGLDSSVRQTAPMQRLVEMKADYHLNARDTVYQQWAEKFPTLATARTGEEFLWTAKTEKAGKLSFEAADRFYDNLMMEFALLVGVIHIALSFLRNIRESWAGLGWIVAMAGAYLYFPDYLQSTSLVHFALGIDKVWAAENGIILVSGGIGTAVFLAVLQSGLGGLAEILNIIGVFSDVLSYLRLYALGLAGAMMSSTFNEIGASMPFALGILVIVIGHIVNIVLSLMGGVIHGLRLNFLEWYHYCFEGGGILFRPLSLQKVN